MHSSMWRSRWAAIGAAVSVTLGAGGLYSVRADSAPSSLVAVSPTRILDTRTGLGLSGLFTSGVPRNLQVTGTIPVVLPDDSIGTAPVVPAGATAIVANVTAVIPTSAGFVSVRPGDVTTPPKTSNINTTPNGVLPNSVTVEVPTTGANAGQIQLWFQGTGDTQTTHLLVDIVGYYQAGSGPAGPPGPPGPAGASARQQRLVSLTSGPNPLLADFETQPAIALGADRLPIIAFFNDTVDDLYVVRCLAACAGAVPFAVETAGGVGWAPSIAIGSDGLAVISHGTVGAPGLRVRHCSTVACDSSAGVVIDSLAAASTPSSIAIGTDGLPIIAYASGTDVRTVHCSDVACTPGPLVVSTTHTTPVVDPLYISIVIGSDGLPVIAHQTGDGDLAVTHCANVTCAASTQVIADNTSLLLGYDASIAIGADGFPIIAHRLLSAGTDASSDLRITHCTTLTCSSATSTTVDAGPNAVGFYTSIAIGTDGVPIIAHRDDTANTLKVARCTDATCASIESIPTDAGPGSGFLTSMIIDALGLPVITHMDTTSNNDIRVTILTNQGWGP